MALFYQIFRGDLLGEGTKMKKNESNAEHHSVFPLFKNQIRFRFEPSVRQIWLFQKKHYFTKFGTFPNLWENRIFPEHAVFAKMCPLSCFMILSHFERNLSTKFSVKFEKLPKTALFTTQSQIPKPQDFFSKIRPCHFFPILRKILSINFF